MRQSGEAEWGQDITKRVYKTSCIACKGEGGHLQMPRV